MFHSKSPCTFSFIIQKIAYCFIQAPNFTVSLVKELSRYVHPWKCNKLIYFMTTLFFGGKISVLTLVHSPSSYRIRTSPLVHSFPCSNLLDTCLLFHVLITVNLLYPFGLRLSLWCVLEYFYQTPSPSFVASNSASARVEWKKRLSQKNDAWITNHRWLYLHNLSIFYAFWSTLNSPQPHYLRGSQTYRTQTLKIYVLIFIYTNNFPHYCFF
jgi:hypothetical protein